MEGQELLADVHGTHVHEADPWGFVTIGVHDSSVQPCEEGCEGRRRRPMALRVGRGEQRLVVVEGFHCGSLALKNELGIHVGHEMPGGEEHGDVPARVHDDVLSASGEPPAFEQSQHLAARPVDVDDPAAVRDASIHSDVHSIFCWPNSRTICVVAAAHSFPSSPLGFLRDHPSNRMNFRDWRAEKR